MPKKIKIKRVLADFILVAGIVGFFSYLHLLNSIYILILMILCLVAVPINIYATQKRNYEKNRFDCLCLYMKNITVNYKISNKILTSLENTLGVFEEGDKMYSCIHSAIEKLRFGSDYKEALAEITKYYDNYYVRTIHEFMILGEVEAGMSVSTSLSQVNVKGWQQEVEVIEDSKEKVKNRFLMFAVGTLSLSYYILTQLKDYLYLLENDTTYQISTFIYFVCFIVVYVLCNLILIGKWVEEK